MAVVWRTGFSGSTDTWGGSPSPAAQQGDGKMVMVRTDQMGKKHVTKKDTNADLPLGQAHVGITKPRTVCGTFKLPFPFSR